MALGLGLHTAPLITPLSWEPKDGRLNDELIFWLKNNTNVSTGAWLDESDNNNDATQSVGGRQPSVNEGGLEFDGVADVLNFDNLITINPDSDFSLCIALEMYSDIENTLLEYDAVNRISLSQNDVISVSGGNPEVVSTTATTTSGDIYNSTEKIWIILQRSASGSTLVSTNKKLSFNYNPSSFTNGLTINKLGGVSDGYLDATILEVFMYNTIFTSGELKKAKDYLKYKFSIYR